MRWRGQTQSGADIEPPSTRPDDDDIPMPSAAPSLDKYRCFGMLEAMREDVQQRTYRLRMVLAGVSCFCILTTMVGSSATWWRAFGGVFAVEGACMAAMFLLPTIENALVGREQIGKLLKLVKSDAQPYSGLAAAARLNGDVIMTSHFAFGALACASSILLSPASFHGKDSAAYWSDPTLLLFFGATPIVEMAVGFISVLNGMSHTDLVRWGGISQFLIATSQMRWIVPMLDDDHVRDS